MKPIKTKYISVRVSDEQKERVKKFCKKNRINITDFVNAAIDAALNN